MEKTFRCSRCDATSPLEHYFTSGGRAYFGNDKICITCSSYSERVSGVAKSVASSIALSILVGGALTGTPEGAAAFIVAMPLFTFLIIVMHELGHAFAGEFVGARVVGLSFGSGLHKRVVRWRDRFLIFGLRPVEGLTVISDVPQEGYRWRMIVTFAAGPAINLLVAAISWSIYRSTEFESDLGGTLFFFWTFLNAFIGLTNLLPFGGNSVGSTASDGRQIFAHLRASEEEMEASSKLASMSEAYLEYLYGDPNRVVGLLDDELKREPLDPAVATMATAAMATAGQYDRGISVCEQALEEEPDSEMEAILKNNLAYLLLERGDENDLERIGELSAAAMNVLPMMLSVRSTRGAYLVRAGNSMQALGLLEDKRYVLESKDGQGRAAADLALAYAQIGRFSAAKKALQKAVTLAPQAKSIELAREVIRAG